MKHKHLFFVFLFCFFYFCAAGEYDYESIVLSSINSSPERSVNSSRDLSVEARTQKKLFQQQYKSIRKMVQVKEVKQAAFKYGKELLTLLQTPLNDVMHSFEKQCKAEAKVVIFGLALSKCKIDIDEGTVSGLVNHYYTEVNVKAVDEDTLGITLVTEVNADTKISDLFPLLRGTPVGNIYAHLGKLIIATNEKNSQEVEPGIHLTGSFDVAKQIPQLKQFVSAASVSFKLELVGSGSVADVTIENNIMLTASVDQLSFGPEVKCRRTNIIVASKSPFLSFETSCSVVGFDFSASFVAESATNITFHGELTKPLSNFLGVDGLQVNVADIEGVITNGKLEDIRLFAKAHIRDREVDIKYDHSIKTMAMTISKVTLKDLVSLVKLDVAVPDMSLSEAEIIFEKQESGLTFKFGARTAGALLDIKYDAFATFIVSPSSVDMSVALNDDINLGPLEVQKPAITMIFARKNDERSVFVSGTASFWKYNGIQIKAIVSKQNGKTGFAVTIDLPQKFNLGSAVPALKGTIASAIQFEKTAVQISSYPIVGVDGKSRQGIVVMSTMKLQGDKLLDGMKMIFGDVTIPVNLALGGSFSSIDPRKVKISSSVAFPEQHSKFVRLHSPVSLEFGFAPLVSVSAGIEITIRLPKDMQPIRLRAEMKFDAIGAAISGEAMNEWVEPFGFKGIIIRKIVIDFGIVYQVFAATGTPSRVGALGYFKFPSVGEVKLAGLVDYVTSQMIMQAEIGRIPVFAFYELLKLGGTFLNVDLPSFEFRDVGFVMAPNGGNIGSVVFEPGFSFKGTLVFLDNKILESKLLINPTDGFTGKMKTGSLTIGPLKIGSVEIDIAATKKNQHFSMSASLAIKGPIKVQQSISIKVSKTSLDFEVANVIYTAKVKANLAKIEDLEIEGTLRTEIINQIMKQMKAGIKIITNEMDKLKDEIVAAKKEVDRLTNEFDKLKAPSSCATVLSVPEDYESLAYHARTLAIRKLRRALRSVGKKVKKTAKKATSTVSKGMKQVGKETMKQVKEGIKLGKAACDFSLKQANSLKNQIDVAVKKVNELEGKLRKLAAKYVKEFLDGDVFTLNAISFKAKLKDVIKSGKISLRIDYSLLGKQRRAQITSTDLDNLAEMAKSLINKLVKK